MTIPVCYHLGSSGNFKHCYMPCVRGHLGSCFSDAVHTTGSPKLMQRVFFHMMPFMNLRAFGECPGISFVDGTMIPLCHNPGRRSNKVFKDIATDGRSAMDGFKLHLPCNGCGEVMTFRLTRANVGDRDARVWNVFARELYGKVFADRGTSNGHSSRNSSTGAYTSCTS